MIRILLRLELLGVGLVMLLAGILAAGLGALVLTGSGAREAQVGSHWNTIYAHCGERWQVSGLSLRWFSFERAAG